MVGFRLRPCGAPRRRSRLGRPHAIRTSPIRSSARRTRRSTDAPNAPPPIHRDHATRVVVHLEVKEVGANSPTACAIRSGPSVVTCPASSSAFARATRSSSTSTITPTTRIPHNIDLHAVNGPGGGAAASLTAPGHSSVFSFKALNPGLFVYHCATAPVAMHVGNGMYGLILVEPKEGLPKVDHEYYLMQGDFYTQGKNGEKGLQPFSMEKVIDEKPEYIVFNGRSARRSATRRSPPRSARPCDFFVGDGARMSSPPSTRSGRSSTPSIPRARSPIPA